MASRDRDDAGFGGWRTRRSRSTLESFSRIRRGTSEANTPICTNKARSASRSVCRMALCRRISFDDQALIPQIGPNEIYQIPRVVAVVSRYGIAETLKHGVPKSGLSVAWPVPVRLL